MISRKGISKRNCGLVFSYWDETGKVAKVDKVKHTFGLIVAEPHLYQKDRLGYESE